MRWTCEAVAEAMFRSGERELVLIGEDARGLCQTQSIVGIASES